MDKKSIVSCIIENLGGVPNIVSVTNCMTRLRVVVKAEENVREEELKNAESVLALVHDRPFAYEVVVGPGNSRQYADLCHEMGLPAAAEESGWKENKAALRAGQKDSKIKTALKALGDVFIPLIPGIIAAGLCAGFASLLTQLVPGYKDSRGWYLVYLLLTMINTSFMTYITAWAGYRAAERFGATPILGGMLGMITSLPDIDNVSKILGLYNADTPLQSILKSGKGGVLAVVCGVFLLAMVEKAIRKKMPPSMDIIFTPLLTLLICAVPYILIIMPVFGYISSGIVWVFSAACMSESAVVRLIVGFAASALFLPMVAAGMHHGMVALYTVQLEALGYVTLYPALAMAGAGQVGAAIALYRKAKKLKHDKLCSVIKGALPAGFLGVGEPLIYGVTLPMGRPFLTAGLGAGFGGAFVMLCQVASTTWGPSGLLAVFVMTAGKGGPLRNMAMYLIGLVISYIMSYFITRAVIRDEEVAEALGGIPAESAAAALDAEKKDHAGDIAKAAAQRITASVPEQESEAEQKEEQAERIISVPMTVRHGDPVIFGMGPTLQFEHVVKDPVGIHARPAAELVKLASGFGSKVTVRKGEQTASGKSVIELMALGASQGSRLVISVTGADAAEAADALRQYLDEKL